MTTPFPFFFAPNVAVTLTAVPPVVVENFDGGDGLRIEWNVEKTNKPQADTGTVRIYNLARATREVLEAVIPVLPAFSFVGTIAVGWGRIGTPHFVPPFRLISGNITKIVPNMKTGVDVVTEVTIGDSMTSGRDSVASQTLTNIQGFTWSTAIAAVAAQQGRTLSPLAPAFIDAAATAKKIPLTQLRNLNLRSGDLEQILTDLLATLGLNFVVQDNVISVFDKSGLRQDLPQVILRAEGGLLDFAVRDDGGVDFTALANPLVQPGSQVTIFNEVGVLVGGGPLRVEHVAFDGSTYESSTMSGTARKFQVI